MGEISRRGVISAAVGAAVAPVVTGGVAEADQPAQRPNVLVILGDDLGWADLSCYGSPFIRTPHLDRLAAEGVRFTQAYSAAAVCSPTRFALYTGRYPGRLPGGLQEPISGPHEQHGIPADHPTLASLLRQAGYTTAMFGKWHCGHLPWFSPTKSGWDTFFGNFGGALDYYSKMTPGGHDLYEGEVPAESLDYYTDTIAERAAAFVRADHDGPWLLNLNFTAPHWPWEAPGDVEVSKELTDRLANGDLQALVHNDGGSLETYRKMVEAMDAGIGRVLAALRGSGKERDTFILFSSDNGGERWSYQWPLSGNKGGLFEGGIRVPTIVRWPARVQSGQTSDVPVITQDWTATILDAAAVQPAPTHPLDGRSLVSCLVDSVIPDETDLFWRTRTARALRRGRWKFLRQGTNPDALYDLVTDPRERANQARRYPDTVARLSARWEEINNDQLPYP